MSAFISLNQNRDFKRLYARGKSVVTPYAVVYYARNRQSITRLGITATKKLGNAVCRNRCRRLIRESFRGLAPEIIGDYDIVIVARSRLLNVKCDTVKKALKSAFAQCNLFEKQ